MQPLPRAVINCLKHARDGVTTTNFALVKSLDDLKEFDPLLYAEVRALLEMGRQLGDKLDAFRKKTGADVEPKAKPTTPARRPRPRRKQARSRARKVTA